MRLGEVIARRKYSVVGQNRKFTIEIGKPRKYRGSCSYYCPYRFSADPSQKIRYASGEDPVQALELTFFKIGVELKYIFNKERRLRWLETSDKELHWPDIRLKKARRS